MTRINTNVSSLVAQNTLVRSHAALDQSLTRLSTGLRINTGKDDPAGLIASENLRSDITSIQRAIGNTDRANQVIATADSALGQVSSLLNDIRGLVTESANTGALSKDQIAADQLQIDSSLKALNRIAQTTTFQGRRLLDGSLDFITTAGTGFGTVSDLKIDTANLGSTGSVAVAVKVSSAASRAQVTNTGGIPAATSAAAASGTVVLSHNIAQASGTLQFDSEATGTLTLAGETFNLAALNGGDAESAEGNAAANLVVAFGQGSASSTYDASTHTLTVNVTQASTVATIQDVIDAVNTGTDFAATLGGATAATTVATGDDSSATFALTGGQDTITLAAVASGNADGVEGNAVAILAITYGAGSADTSYDASTHTLSVSVTQASGVATEQNILDAINGGTDFTATAGTNANATLATGDDATAAFALTGGRAAGAGTITVTAGATGVNTHTVTLSEDNSIANNTAVAAFDGSGNITVKVHGTVAYSAIKAQIDGLAGYTATLGTNSGDQNYVQSLDTPPSATTLAGGVSASGGLDSAIVFELSGSTGADVLSFGAGTGISTIVDAINAGSDSTGITATNVSGVLTLTSTAYGTDAFVNVHVLSGDDNGTFATGLSATRTSGTNIVASVNGIEASGRGNTLSINTASLDLSLTVNAGSSTDVNFTIDGGGALFQLGPDVVSNQQARIGITSVNTARLGGVSGKLFQLGSGGSADLNSDPTTAASIVDEAINQITSLRGRLGAFQRTSLETNKNALNDTLVNLTDAQSQIRDADFASETANLTRAQILVQSGTTVLGIANQNPQNVLALLRNA